MSHQSDLPTAEDLALFDLLMHAVADEPDMSAAILTGPDEMPLALRDELTRRTLARLAQQTGAENLDRARRIKQWLACKGLEPLVDAIRMEHPSLTSDEIVAVAMLELAARYGRPVTTDER